MDNIVLAYESSSVLLPAGDVFRSSRYHIGCHMLSFGLSALSCYSLSNCRDFQRPHRPSWHVQIRRLLTRHSRQNPRHVVGGLFRDTLNQVVQLKQTVAALTATVDLHSRSNIRSHSRSAFQKSDRVVGCQSHRQVPGHADIILGLQKWPHNIPAPVLSHQSSVIHHEARLTRLSGSLTLSDIASIVPYGPLSPEAAIVVVDSGYK